jgi:hypothetical protein
MPALAKAPLMLQPSMLQTAKLLTLAAIGLAIMAPPVDAAFSKKVRIACSADAKRLCATSKLGSPEMEYCMEAKGKYLSRECKRALEDDGVIPRGYFSR